MKKTDRPIVFEFEGVQYEASQSFYDTGMCILPDGRVVKAGRWLESLPPIPGGLKVIAVPTAKQAT